MKHLRAAIAALLLLVGIAPAAAQIPNLPQNTIFGRLGVGTGPGQAIPFSTLVDRIGGVSSTRAINTTAPLAGGGDLSADRTLSITGLSGGVLAGAGPAFTRTPTLGVAGSTVGSISFANATSGTVTLQPVTGALASAVASLPAGTYNVVGDSLTQALTGKTYNGLTITTTTGTLTISNGKTATHSATTTFAGTDGKTLTTSNSLTLAGTDGKTLTLTNGLTVSGNDGTLSFGGASKTLTVNKSLTLEGTDSTTMTFPSVSATIPRTVASGAKALATSAISSAACTSAQTDTATGTLTTDAIIATFNGDPTAVTGYVPLTTGMLTIIVYPTADTVNFKVCNNTSGSITPGAITLNWRVVR